MLRDQSKRAFATQTCIGGVAARALCAIADAMCQHGVGAQQTISGFVDVMASLGGDLVSEREVYIRLLRGSMLGPLSDPDFANVLSRYPAPPESSTTSSASSSTRVRANLKALFQGMLVYWLLQLVF